MCFPLFLPLRAETRETCDTDVGVSPKLLHILWRCSAPEQIARECVAKLMEMKNLQTVNLFACRPAHNPYCTRRFIRPVRSEADKGDFLVSFGNLRRSRQAANLVVSTVFFPYLGVVVEVVNLSILETVFVLFGFRRFEDCRRRVAKVHGTDFLSYLGFAPCPVVADTAACRYVCQD